MSKGFTYHPSSGVKKQGNLCRTDGKIPYLKELGINAVELMPVFEFDETMNARRGGRRSSAGLLGLQFGEFLRRRAVMQLRREYNQGRN